MKVAARRIGSRGGGGGLLVEKGPAEGGEADSRMAKSWGTTMAKLACVTFELALQ